MSIKPYILLADDDPDDRMFFSEALEELLLSYHLTEVRDGEELMQFLSKNVEKLPYVIFLDLNMPRKNGFQCLVELKKDERFQWIPVVIISTYHDHSTSERLYNDGASYYIQKPNGIPHLRKLIALALKQIENDQGKQPERNSFLVKL